MLHDLTVLVTGASCCAGALRCQSWVNYRGGAERAGEVIRQIEKAGGQAIVVKANASNKNDVDNILSRSIDVLAR